MFFGIILKLFKGLFSYFWRVTYHLLNSFIKDLYDFSYILKRINKYTKVSSYKIVITITKSIFY